MFLILDTQYAVVSKHWIPFYTPRTPLDELNGMDRFDCIIAVNSSSVSSETLVITAPRDLISSSLSPVLMYTNVLASGGWLFALHYWGSVLLTSKALEQDYDLFNHTP